MSAKSTTIKRILKEAAELSASPSPDYHAAPQDSNLFEWHFTLRGPPAPSPFSTGIYHGRITLPPAYPLRPPSFRFLTPSGRFEVNREICLSISGHHEETWQPAWGIRTALVALRSFMDEEVGGQVGGLSAHEVVRRELAGKSAEWCCGGCGGRSNREILEGREGVGEVEAEEQASELVGKIKLVEKKKKKEEDPSALASSSSAASGDPSVMDESLAQQSSQTAGAAAVVGESTHVLRPTPTTTTVPPTQQSQPQVQVQVQAPHPPPPPQAANTTDAWIDKAIIGIIVAIIFMVVRRYA